jgi:hypothetical protein
MVCSVSLKAFSLTSRALEIKLMWGSYLAMRVGKVLHTIPPENDTLARTLPPFG